MDNSQSQRESKRKMSSWCSRLLSPIASILPNKIPNSSNHTPITPPPPHINTSLPSPNLTPLPSSSSSSVGEFEVFLSFRGPNTRRGFTDFLYTFLVDARIRTCRDDEELRKGEVIGPELLSAISHSKISIPILSRDYASSKWCLRELAKIVECKNVTGQKILPIFYYVEPSDVRHQAGCYADAFSRHEKHCDKHTVQKWREALSEVGALKGWTVKENSSSDGEQRRSRPSVLTLSWNLKLRDASQIKNSQSYQA